MSLEEPHSLLSSDGSSPVIPDYMQYGSIFPTDFPGKQHALNALSGLGASNRARLDVQLEALEGDARLSLALIRALRIQYIDKGVDVATITQRKQKYESNATMRFYLLEADVVFKSEENELIRYGDNVTHLMGTLFEYFWVVADKESYRKNPRFDTFRALAYITWVDERADELQAFMAKHNLLPSPSPSPSPSFPTENKQGSETYNDDEEEGDVVGRFTIRRDGLLLHVFDGKTKLSSIDLADGHEESESVFLSKASSLLSHSVKRSVKRERVVQEEKLLESLDKIPLCYNCDQRRCVIYRCGTSGTICERCRLLSERAVFRGLEPIKPCRRYWRQCFVDGYAETLQLEEKDERLHGRNMIPTSVNVPNVIDTLPDKEATSSGFPLSCPVCKSCALVVDHCSNNYKCKHGSCSNRYPCKKYISWTCAQCHEARRLSRIKPRLQIEREYETDYTYNIDLHEPMIRRLQSELGDLEPSPPSSQHYGSEAIHMS